MEEAKCVRRDMCTCGERSFPGFGMSLSRKKSLARSWKLGPSPPLLQRPKMRSGFPSCSLFKPQHLLGTRHRTKDMSQALNSDGARSGRKARRKQRQIRDAIEIPFRPSIASSYLVRNGPSRQPTKERTDLIANSLSCIFAAQARRKNRNFT